MLAIDAKTGNRNAIEETENKSAKAASQLESNARTHSHLPLAVAVAQHLQPVNHITQGAQYPEHKSSAWADRRTGVQQWLPTMNFLVCRSKSDR